MPAQADPVVSRRAATVPIATGCCCQGLSGHGAVTRGVAGVWSLVGRLCGDFPAVQADHAGSLCSGSGNVVALAQWEGPGALLSNAVRAGRWVLARSSRIAERAFRVPSVRFWSLRF
jgi:hypothetical protein